MEKTRNSAIMLVLLSSIVVAFAQLLWKLSSKNLELNPLVLLANLPLILGFVLYGIGAGILIYALRHGELSVLYPIYASTYIWVTILSVIFLSEKVPVLRWTGVLVIIAGVALISTGGRK